MGAVSVYDVTARKAAYFERKAATEKLFAGRVVQDDALQDREGLDQLGRERGDFRYVLR